MFRCTMEKLFYLSSISNNFSLKRETINKKMSNQFLDRIMEGKEEVFLTMFPQLINSSLQNLISLVRNNSRLKCKTIINNLFYSLLSKRRYKQIFLEEITWMEEIPWTKDRDRTMCKAININSNMKEKVVRFLTWVSFLVQVSPIFQRRRNN